MQIEAKVFSSIYLQFKKINVDHFYGGQMVPRCELLLRWPHTDKPHECLEHGIDLIGAKGCSFFTLYIPDAGEQYEMMLSKIFMQSFLIFLAIVVRLKSSVQPKAAGRDIITSKDICSTSCRHTRFK